MSHNLLGEPEKTENSPGLYHRILKRPRIEGPSREGMCVANIARNCLKA